MHYCIRGLAQCEEEEEHYHSKFLQGDNPHWVNLVKYEEPKAKASGQTSDNQLGFKGNSSRGYLGLVPTSKSMDMIQL